MFEDFENRSGFWKGLGSNFTINHSGSTPSFISSGEMWQSMDGATTQTLAAWENGWVLTNNPDGTMTANPKYTSGLLSQTLVRVPVGPSSPNAVQPSTGGGVVVAYTAENRVFAFDYTLPQNVIKISHSCHGGHRSKMRYGIEYAEPTTELKGRGVNTLEEALHDSKSGERSNATLPIIHSYWAKDADLAIGKPMSANQTGRFGIQKNREANYCDEPVGHKEEDTDPNDCASEHRAVNDDETCGDCQTGYSEDADGNCIADETEEAGTNWLLYGGIAAVAAFALLG